MRLLIVIVNYKTAGLTVDCLESLAVQIDPSVDRVVAVDNCSEDGSLEFIAKALLEKGWSDWGVVEQAPGNDGFAAGNNFGIRLGGEKFGAFEYTLLLNPDTRVLDQGIRTLVDFMEQHREVGIAGSRLENPDGTPRCSAFRFASIASEFERGARLGIITRLLRHKVVAPEVRDEPHRAGWVAGASMIVRQRVFDDIGLMDTAYFLYYEETDFCLLAHRAGWACWYVPSSRVTHLVGQSTGVTGVKRTLKPLPGYWYESRRRYFRKNHGRVYAWLADLAWLSGHLIYRLKSLLLRTPREDPPNMLGGFLRYALLGKRGPAS